MKEYPTKQELSKIKKWNVLKRPIDLLNFIRNIWWCGETACIIRNNPDTTLFELHTYGWSGNEEIINALQENPMFWMLYWQKSTRGGHYYFEVYKLKNENKKEKKEKV